MIPITNAAGQVKHPHDVDPLLPVPADFLSAITLGSYTLEERAGNSGNTFWTDNAGSPTSLNALGLPNPGMRAAREFLPDLMKKIHATGKRVRISIAGFSVEEFKELAKIVVGLRPDEIEWNLGCPNVRVEGKQKPIFAFDIDSTAAILKDAHRVCGTLGEPGRAVKVSPYSDPFFLSRFAGMLAEHENHFEKLVVCNTFPNGYGFADNSKPLIDANDGYAGLAGHPMKHIMLGQVRQFRKILPRSKEIIAVSGIAFGIDILDCEHAGASEAQVGTAFFVQGPRIFQDIAQGYVSSE